MDEESIPLKFFGDGSCSLTCLTSYRVCSLSEACVKKCLEQQLFVHETLFKVLFWNVVKTIESEASTSLFDERFDTSLLT